MMGVMHRWLSLALVLLACGSSADDLAGPGASMAGQGGAGDAGAGGEGGEPSDGGNAGQGGQEAGAGGSAMACTPGLSVACVGPGACQGGQVCAADGSGYGPCDCGQAGGGGASAGAGGQPDAGKGGATAGGGQAQGGSGQPAGSAGAQTVPENSKARCMDGLDNDGDGAIDCNDPGCCGLVDCTGIPSVCGNACVVPKPNGSKGYACPDGSCGGDGECCADASTSTCGALTPFCCL